MSFDGSSILSGLLVVAVVALVSLSLKKCEASQRFAVLRLSQYLGLKGPGLLILLPIIDKAYILSIGDRGQMLTNEAAIFHGLEIPVSVQDRISVGAEVAIVEFRRSREGWSIPVVALSV